jgi:hypothetical protein
MKAQVFFHVYPEDGLEEDGEYLSYSCEYEDATELRLFLDKVEDDWNERIRLIGEGKSMLSAELKK